MKTPVAALVGALSLVACQPPVVQPGAGTSPSGEKPFYLPGEATPVPPGVVGTADPFYATHQPTSTIVFPGANGASTTLEATYKVAGVAPLDGAWRLSFLANGKAKEDGKPMEVRFELLVDRPPSTPASFPIKRSPTLGKGIARVTHYRGAGAGWEGRSGSISFTRVERSEEAVAFDFSIEGVLEPVNSGPGTAPSASPGAIAPASALPGASSAPVAPSAPVASKAPVGVPSATSPGSAARHLLQLGSEVLIRWTGTFYVKPGDLP